MNLPIHAIRIHYCTDVVEDFPGKKLVSAYKAYQKHDTHLTPDENFSLTDQVVLNCRLADRQFKPDDCPHPSKFAKWIFEINRFWQQQAKSGSLHGRVSKPISPFLLRQAHVMIHYPELFHAHQFKNSAKLLERATEVRKALRDLEKTFNHTLNEDCNRSFVYFWSPNSLKNDPVIQVFCRTQKLVETFTRFQIQYKLEDPRARTKSKCSFFAKWTSCLPFLHKGNNTNVAPLTKRKKPRKLSCQVKVLMPVWV